MSTSVISRAEASAIPGFALETHLAPTIFHEPWWLETASEGTYQEAVVSTDGVVVGRLPYQMWRKSPGLTSLGLPAMTHMLGPALDESAGGSQLRRQIKNIGITSKLLAQLPSCSHISFRLHGDITDTLAFGAAGFTSGVDFTVEVPPVSDDVLWRQMRDKTRNIIRRAQESLIVAESENSEEFLLFYESNLASKNRYPIDISRNIINNCISRKVGRILFAHDSCGDLQAALFCVWDAKREYYFMSTRTAGSNSGAVSMLIWSAIRHASARGLIFDMYGVHVVGNNLPNLHLVTGFGGALKPLLTVRRSSPIVRVCHDIKKIVRKDRLQ